MIGTEESETTASIQREIIPHTERWAEQSGAMLKADKTTSIHFTKRTTIDDTQAVNLEIRAKIRQLWKSYFLQVIDYAASAWYGPEKHGVVRLACALEKVQRLGARTTIRT
jgi:hypothetical protein